MDEARQLVLQAQDLMTQVHKMNLGNLDMDPSVEAAELVNQLNFLGAQVDDLIEPHPEDSEELWGDR